MIREKVNPIRNIGTSNFVLCLLMSVHKKIHRRRLGTRLTKRAVEFEASAGAGKVQKSASAVETAIKMATVKIGKEVRGLARHWPRL